LPSLDTEGEEDDDEEGSETNERRANALARESMNRTPEEVKAGIRTMMWHKLGESAARNMDLVWIWFRDSALNQLQENPKKRGYEVLNQLDLEVKLFEVKLFEAIKREEEALRLEDEARMKLEAEITSTEAEIRAAESKAIEEREKKRLEAERLAYAQAKARLELDARESQEVHARIKQLKAEEERRRRQSRPAGGAAEED
jgi:hypothetical protein